MNRKQLVLLPAVFFAASIMTIQPPCCRATHAYDSPDTTLAQGQNFSITVRGSAGILGGEAHELVYDSGSGSRRKVSELIWDLEGLNMIGGLVSANICNWVNINLGISSAINEGSGGMLDYDWFPDISGAPSPDDWTHRSYSDVQVTTATIFDLNASLKLFSWENINFKGILGFKQDTWEWTDSGQDYIYSTRSFRDTIGSFGGKNVINYEQTFTIPYIGLSANRKAGPFDIGAYFLLSTGVSAEDKDYHVLRELYFKETFSGGTYIALGINAIYRISTALFITAAIDYQSIPEISGDMEISEPNGDTAVNSDAAGISHSSTMLSGSIGYNF